MNKIKVSQTGEVDIKSIEVLSYDELKEWIKTRLHGKDRQIPSDFRQGDTPYYIISLLYPKLNRYVREDINRIVCEFVRDMARNPDTTWQGEAGNQLLLLTNSINARETLSFLLEMAKSYKFFVEDVSSLEKDLHFRVLQTLVSLGYRVSYEFWLEQYQIRPERYAKIVFNGMALISPEQAIRFLTSIDSVKTVERILFITFPSLLNEYGIDGIVPLVEKYLPKMMPDICSAVQEFFSSEGYDLEYKQHQKEIESLEDFPQSKLRLLADFVEYLQDKTAWEETQAILADKQLMKDLESAEIDWNNKENYKDWEEIKEEV